MTALAAAEATREVFWNIPLGLKVVWYVLAAASTAVFLYGCARPFLKYRAGRGRFVPTDRAERLRRIRHELRALVTHAPLRRRNRFAGWAHMAIFYGFVVLFVGTVILTINTDVTEPIFGWRFFQGDFYLGYKLVLNLLGLALLVGLLGMMVRRSRKPPELDYRHAARADEALPPSRRRYRVGDWVFVVTLLAIVVTGYLLEGVRFAMDSPGHELVQGPGWLIGEGFTALGLSEAALAAVRHGLWWFHGLLAISFVAAIPFTKASHMLASAASRILRDPLAARRLAPIPDELADAPAGYGTLADFSPLHLMQLDACTKCGRCHVACPAFATGMPLSPRDVVLDLREQANAALAGRSVGGVLGDLLARRTVAERLDEPVVGPAGVREETIWSCMQCNACVDACPVGIEQAPIINQIRRRLVEEGEMDAGLQTTLQTIHRAGNSFGEAARTRGHWTKELEFEVKDARRAPVEMLWFVGDYASFDPRSQRVTRTVARLLHQAGVDFGILYDGERNAGNDVRRVGEEGLFEALAETNAATLDGCEFERILTTDPHSLNTLRNEYPTLGGGTWDVVHHTQLLVELLDTGRLVPKRRLHERVTYHDPCYLGRVNGEYEAARTIIERTGCTLVEMQRNRAGSFCCGAGGGRIWMPDVPGAERPSENRIREAMQLDVELFAVACPKDVTMYEDAIKTTGHADELRLVEVTELLERALTPEPAPALSGAPTR